MPAVPFRPQVQGQYKKPGGFTLIELLVVLAIVGALGALVAPDLWKTYQRANERLSVIEYGSELGFLRRELMEKKSSLSLERDALDAGDGKEGLPGLPGGWVITANSEILFLPSGVTSGGQIELESPAGNLWLLTLQPLDGAMDVEFK